ncbi:protealysin inhibitor emfourin [Nocardioides insulae]|uniref:protealysin inhibitor emfourin n=1 Tax=Nocardioides insulae TaxID=394734 RepID=UPI00048DA5C7|nr:protealysin inhibitor emfourin [Nocardioides insulae]
MTDLTCSFVPPYLLETLSYTDTLALDRGFRAARPAMTAHPEVAAAAAAWVVHTADNGTRLPGRVVRQPGDPATGDVAVDEAAEGIAASLAMFAEVYGRESYDGAGATVSGTVHYGQDYVNAFWDGQQLVFGDGDGEVFDRFTKPVDVLGHEFTHAVTEHTAGLVYRDQSGALNESVSDVFAACLKQRLLGQSADQADWLIGEGLFLPGVQARGLRDMLNPGTAYDDPRLGRDPQPAHMDDFVVTRDDNGGVHLNSGIPNRAFALAARAIGGSAAEGAGRVWWAALTSTAVGPRSDFAQFAAATVAAAGEHEQAVVAAWEQVGVGAAATPGEVERPPAPDTQVSVRRTGGFTGIPASASIDLNDDDDRARELLLLVQRIDLAAVGAQPEEPRPDRFVYDVDLCGERCQVPETALTDDLSRVVDLVLGR